MTPTYASVKRWCEISGIGRTSTYGLLAAGGLRAVKVGRRTLIDVDAGIEWLRNRPAASINGARPDRAAA